MYEARPSLMASLYQNLFPNIEFARRAESPEGAWLGGPAIAYYISQETGNGI